MLRALLSFRFGMPALLWSVVFAAGCENCADNYKICVSNVSVEVLDSYSYEYTCMYPTMTVGDARIYCECRAEYLSCRKD